MPWTCPESGDNAANAQAIIATDAMFFDWMNSPARQGCKNVSADDVFQAMQTRGSGVASTTIATLNTEIVEKKKALETKTLEASIAKDRASMNSRPEMTANYYDGWFPLNRPMKRTTVTALMGIATFFLVIGLFLTLNLFGIQTNFSVYVPYSEIGSSKPIIILLGIIVVLVGVIVYNYMY
jgi:hypothetical protein